MIEIVEKPWQTMVAHAENTYPDECCGALLGRIEGQAKLVTEAVPLQNAFEGVRRERYEVNSEDLLKAEKAAREMGLDLLGIFHSHPDCDAYFSDTDLRNSCPWYSFVVLSVYRGKFDHANSFLPDLDQTKAESEQLIWPKS